MREKLLALLHSSPGRAPTLLSPFAAPIALFFLPTAAGITIALVAIVIIWVNETSRLDDIEDAHGRSDFESSMPQQ